MNYIQICKPGILFMATQDVDVGGLVIPAALVLSALSTYLRKEKKKNREFLSLRLFCFQI